MSNWFQEHPVTSIVGHSLIVAAATGAGFLFIFDENRVKLAEARIESERQRVSQFEAKAGVLEAQIRQLQDDNHKYLTWLTETPNTIPYFQAALKKAATDSDQLREEVAILKRSAGTAAATPVPEKKKYSNSKNLKKGDSLIDDATGAILGFVNVDPSFKGEVYVSVPGRPAEKIIDVSAGMSWEFTKAAKKYRLTLSKLDWYSNTAVAGVDEVE